MKFIEQLRHESHIDRINDWEGSGSYIGPAEVVRNRMADADNTEELHPYLLVQKAVGPHGIIPAGTVVHLPMGAAGPHHAAVEGHTYPKGAEPPPPPMPMTLPPMRDHEAIIRELEGELEAANARIAELEAASKKGSGGGGRS